MSDTKENNEIKQDDWIQSHWRPAMAVAYIVIIIFDFVVGPIFWSLAQIVGGGTVGIQWVPLTTTAGGVFHAAMGAVLGVTAWTRGQEKVEKIRHPRQPEEARNPFYAEGQKLDD
jgi:hypothetical protein